MWWLTVSSPVNQDCISCGGGMARRDIELNADEQNKSRHRQPPETSD
jgi:hypothetical protein